MPGLRFTLVIATVFTLCDSCAAAGIESKLAPLVKEHKGKVGVALKNLKTGEEFYLNADEAMPTASLIKLAVMVEAYWQASEGKVKFDKIVTLKKEDKVPGSGILTPHFSEGATFPYRDAIRLMIAVSDNTATNLVLDGIGIPSTNERMEKLGLKNTKIHAKVYKRDTTSIDMARSKKFGLGSTTPREMVKLLEMIETGKIVSPEACKEMIGHLKTCDDKEKFRRYLPSSVPLAHKTGSVDDIRTDAGLIYLKQGPVALCVMTSENADTRWEIDNAAQVLIAKIAKEVYDHYNKAEKK